MRLSLLVCILLGALLTPELASAQYPLGFPSDYTGAPAPYFRGYAYPGYDYGHAAYSAYAYPTYFSAGSPIFGYPGYGFGFGW